MSSQGHDWNNEWRGLEPEQPRSGRCGCWLGVLALLLALTAICGTAGYFAWQQLGIPLEPGNLLARPTIPPLSSPAPFLNDAIEPLDNPPPTPLANIAPTVTLPSDAAAAPPQDVTAQQMTSPPIIDAGLLEYADFPVTESQFRVFNAQSWDGTDDLRALWRLGWDQENLYLAVQVEDDTHVQTSTGSSIFKGDSLSVQFDTQRTADFGPQLSPDDYQIELSPGDFTQIPPSAHRFRGESSGSFIDFPGHSIQVAAARTGSGYTLEAAIPWRDLGLTPEAGLIIGIALNANDNDTPNTAVQEVMMSHIASRTLTDPTSWGTLLLR
jgi:hypothetical protein